MQACYQEMERRLRDVSVINLPFRHIVIDDFVPLQLLTGVGNAYDAYQYWERSADHDIEVKARSTWKSLFDVPASLIPLVNFFNSALSLGALSKLFEIPRLLSDPYFGGGGMNRSQKDGVLGVHVDGNFSDQTGLHRRLNLILYLTSSWREEWGGHLGFYNETGTVLKKEYEPRFNRLIAFETTDTGFHGISRPISCPEGMYRDSLILYYYTAENRPAAHVVVNAPHSALWVKRGVQDKRGKRVRDA